MCCGPRCKIRKVTAGPRQQVGEQGGLWGSGTAELSGKHFLCMHLLRILAGNIEGAPGFQVLYAFNTTASSKHSWPSVSSHSSSASGHPEWEFS